MAYDASKYGKEQPTSRELKWVGVDLDGTLADSVWPQPGIGEPIIKTVELCQQFSEQGYKIIIHTARPWGDYRNIERWLKDHGIKFKEIQCGKPLYAHYLDDKNYFMDWIND